MIRLTGPVLTGPEAGPAWVRGGTIHYGAPDGATPRAADGVGYVPALDGEPSETLDGYVLPGLVDVHCHIGLGADGGVSREAAEEQALVDRATGVLLVRDAGVPVDTRWIDERPDLPRIIRAGQHIARPKRYIRNYAVELEDVSALPEEMARQARAGDGWVKLVADWIDRSMGADAVITPLWPADMLRDAVAAAHENGARVTAHTFSHAAMDALLDAGIDCIEHGTGMDADHIAEAARRGIPVTPTLLNIDNFTEYAAQGAAKFPAYAEQMLSMHARREDQLRAFVDAGVQLLPGSDSGGVLEHGIIPAELLRWQEAGIDPALVVEFATWRARRFLGAGALADGEPADLVVYAQDPRRDVSVLADPQAVVLRGVRVL
ncbi:MAG TPA: amidohydrolase family protein [Actinomycetales bacterium]|nr:amidohydrolase family protein [Actinomycetales bacterium]